MFLSLILLVLLGNAPFLCSLLYDRNDLTTAHSLALSHLHHIMSGGDAAHATPEPPDVNSTEIERTKGRHIKKDDRVHTQMYLARARIEGIEKWRAAVDAALQAAEEERAEFEETNRKRRRIEEDAWGALEETQNNEIEIMTQDVQVEHTDAVGGTKQKRRSRRHELWKGLRNMFFNIIF
ncbi:hypothetical protein DEU56DRAFT_181608 [Suillus clintonianus]|uniref:uncharacterized protein n=1 Tax=Suillus clintonianus TaxID=1904413 RepID=UPI001B8639DB|nr:uncharacterized protein DEU56DRAFT_181608 [Suillus clintonianus]KAG2145781.1 hypothetical protein DEU56DRAFT_181608 [Suillus clintonianus]